MVTRRSETAGFAFCMKGRDQTANQMTAIHCDQKDDTVSLLAFRESQTDSGSQAPRRLTVGLCFQIEKSSVGGLPPLAAK